MGVFQRWVLHLDLDAFFVEVERRLDPSLVGRPVIVGGPAEGRGVVASVSYEARAFGVHSAMPTAQARRLCPQAIFVAGHYEAYEEYSRRVYGKCLRYTPLAQMASIDEAYLELTGTERLHGSPIDAADRLRGEIAEEIGLPATCGLASNRLVAKVASDTAKPAGRLCVPHGAERGFLASLPLRALPGLGPKSCERLSRYGLKTLGEAAALGETTFVRLFGEEGRWLWRRCIGWDDSPVRPRSRPKSISRDQTFASDLCDLGRLSEALSYLAEKVAAALRDENAAARTLTLKIRYADFKTVTRAVTLTAPTRDDRAIFAVARASLLAAYNRRVRLRLLGVAATNLSIGGWQVDLFEADRAQALERLYAGVDRIRGRDGFRS
ncbi:MAG: DNA polymerase IV, partial [Candidatus Sumerlaeota bacterium]|nr:DNA polymerase IV [Candidatus Sumerlaeota bacterium]